MITISRYSRPKVYVLNLTIQIFFVCFCFTHYVRRAELPLETQRPTIQVASAMNDSIVLFKRWLGAGTNRPIFVVNLLKFFLLSKLALCPEFDLLQKLSKAS